MNQAIFERLLLTDDEVTGTLAGPFDLLIEASGRDSQNASENALKLHEARPADLVV
jgi:hypothetical protein